MLTYLYIFPYSSDDQWITLDLTHWPKATLKMGLQIQICVDHAGQLLLYFLCWAKRPTAVKYWHNKIHLPELNVDSDQCHHVESLGHNELSNMPLHTEVMTRVCDIEWWHQATKS